MHEANASNFILAHPNSSGDYDKDDPSLSPAEPLPDPAPPENLDNPEEVSVHAAKQSKPANSPADIHHAVFNQMKPLADVFTKGLAQHQFEKLVARLMGCEPADRQ